MNNDSLAPELLHIVSISGGKDSTALYLWAIEQFGKDGFRAVFADTGHEHPVTLNYIRNLPLMASGPEIEWVKADFTPILDRKGIEPSENPFLDLCLAKGRVPSTMAQFCTENLKLAPIRDWLCRFRGAREVVMYTGIRRAESRRRSSYEKEDWLGFYQCKTIRPLIDWTEEQVFSYLREKAVPPNPLYEAGFSRVGCFPCIHARKSELARLPDWAWEKLIEWEERIGRSWFPAGLVPGASSHFGENVPTIDQVRQWSKTSRGGKQMDMFAPEAADVPSCMSTWGACE